MLKPLNYVASEDNTRQKAARNRNVLAIHEDFKPLFNTVLTSAVVMQRF